MQSPDENKLDVLYEDNHLLVVNKPPGLLSQSDSSGAPDLLTYAKSYIKKKYAKPGEVFLGLVHRLDRNVGGVLVLARTSKAAARLALAFRERGVRKFYLAAVEGVPPTPAGERVDFLRKDAERRLALVVHAGTPQAREARLLYRVLGRARAADFAPGQADASGDIALLEIELLTGRFHQIRAQLAAMGTPILGDKKYGARTGLKQWTLGLFASGLDLEHPVGGRPLSLRAEPAWRSFFTEK